MDRNKLSYWKEKAKIEITKWVKDDDFRDKISRETLKNEMLGPFTKFLYHFACTCNCSWGVMVDFNERSQRVFLVDRYYKWMHELRDEIENKLKKIELSKNMTKLSVLICSVPERKEMLEKLMQKFYSMLSGVGENCFEFIVDDHDKSLSVGLKRQMLLEKAKGTWIVFFDDDDWPEDHYLSSILTAINENTDIDCIGICGYMTTNGKNRKTWCHRLGYSIKGNGVIPTESGYDYMRPIIHFNPVLREKALKAGFLDMRYGEDMDYANRLNRFLKKEYFIDKDLFHYRFTTHIPHKEKYGITQ